MPQRSDALAYVELTWLEKQIEHWVRFGRIAEHPVLNRRVRIVSFAPDSVFAFVRWPSNDFGTIISRIDVLRAVAPASPFPPCLCPSGGESFSASLAGRTSVAFCAQSIKSRRSASIRPTPRRTTGVTSKTG
jgi:Protein of unknown function (DUF2840)